MEQVLVGALLAVTIGLGTLYWYVMVLPDVFLSMWEEAGGEDAWFDEEPAALRALRWVGGAAVLLLGFLTGFALTFLSTTGG